MASRKLIAALALIAAPTFAQSGLTGSWSGTYNATITIASCSNKTFTWNGNANFVLLQSGTSLTGRLDLTNFTLLNSDCSTSSGEITRVVFGTTDGSTINLSVPNDQNGWQFSGSASGEAIALQLSDPNGLTGTFTLSRAAATPAANFTGTSSGTYSFSDVCPSGSSKISYNGNIALGLTQVGSSAGGVMTLTNVPLYDQNCSTIANLTQQMSVAGSVNGSTFTGAAYDPSGLFDFPFTATLANNAISGSAAGSSLTSTTGTFTLTPSSSQQPAADFSGHYDGTYSETDNGLAFCLNVGNVNFADAASVDLVQSGDQVSGTLALENTLQIVSDGAGDCTVLDGGEEVLPFYGTISNGTVTLTLPLGNGASQVFAFNLAGDTVSGTMQDSFGDIMQFSATRSATTTQREPRRRAVHP